MDKSHDRKELGMKKQHFSHILRSAMSVLLAVSLLMGTVPAVFAAEVAGGSLSRLEISGINKLDKNSLLVNYLDYLNSKWRSNCRTA